MQFTTCDFPGCNFKDSNRELVRPLGMVAVEVKIDYRVSRRFDLCDKHAKSLGLDTKSKPTIGDNLLETLTLFIQDVTPEQ